MLVIYFPSHGMPACLRRAPLFTLLLIIGDGFLRLAQLTRPLALTMSISVLSYDDVMI